MTGEDRFARLAALEQMFEALMIIEEARVRVRERANGTHLHTVT